MAVGGLFGGGIMGRAAGAMLGSAIKAVGQEVSAHAWPGLFMHRAVVDARQSFISHHGDGD